MAKIQSGLGMAAVAALAFMTSGCLQKDVSETWYVQPDAGVTWHIVEKDVRSDAPSVAERQQEELDYLTAVRAEAHPVASAFRQLGATAVETRLLRASQPYTVVTDGRFASIAQLGQRMLDATRVVGASTLQRTAEGFTWTLTFRDPLAEEGTGEVDYDIADVMRDFDRLQVVLSDGRFTASEGFELSADERVATLTHGDEPQQTGEIVRALSWTVGR